MLRVYFPTGTAANKNSPETLVVASIRRSLICFFGINRNQFDFRVAERFAVRLQQFSADRKRRRVELR